MASRLNLSLGVNLAGRVLNGLVSFIVTPILLHQLGAEGFGLVGLYTLVLAILNFANVGLGEAANREAARARSGVEIGGVLRAYAWAAWLAAALVALLMAASGGYIASSWLNAQHLSAATMQQSLVWLGMLVALQVPADFYVGVCFGSGRPVAANVLLSSLAVSRGAAGVLALQFGDATPVTFFISQVAVSLVVLFGAMIDFARHAPGKGSTPILSTWLGAWRFPAGMATVALTSMVIGQLDRFVLSRALQLEDFGYYSIATTLANSLYFLIGPIQAAYYPEFSRLAAGGDPAALSRVYHEACQRMAMLVMPVGAILAFFAYDVVALWTSRAAVAGTIAPVVAFLVGSRLIGAMNTLPYSLQFAHGWTGLVLRMNLGAILVLCPGVAILAAKFGSNGAAAGYFVLSLPFLVIIAWRMHRRLLPGEASTWLLHDNLPHLVIAFAVAAAGKLAQPAELSAWSRFAWLAVTSATALGASVAWHAPTRQAILRRLGFSPLARPA